MNDFEGFVLNGGKSSRMGRPKGSLKLGGLTFVECARNALSAICDRVFVVGGNRVEGIETLPDLRWNEKVENASIFGLHSALSYCSAEFAAVLACDMPFVTGEVFTTLAEKRALLQNGEADVVVPVDINGWLQPLCAIYDRDRCRSLIDRLLITGTREVRELMKLGRPHPVPFADISTVEGSENLFLNINTPEELRAARKRWASPPT